MPSRVYTLPASVISTVASGSRVSEILSQSGEIPKVRPPLPCRHEVFYPNSLPDSSAMPNQSDIHKEHPKTAPEARNELAQGEALGGRRKQIKPREGAAHLFHQEPKSRSQRRRGAATLIDVAQFYIYRYSNLRKKTRRASFLKRYLAI